MMFTVVVYGWIKYPVLFERSIIRCLKIRMEDIKENDKNKNLKEMKRMVRRGSYQRGKGKKVEKRQKMEEFVRPEATRKKYKSRR